MGSLRGQLAQWWHCLKHTHRMMRWYDEEGELYMLSCGDCNAKFWTRE
jgi:hypothetical protein